MIINAIFSLICKIYGHKYTHHLAVSYTMNTETEELEYYTTKTEWLCTRCKKPRPGDKPELTTVVVDKMLKDMGFVECFPGEDIG